MALWLRMPQPNSSQGRGDPSKKEDTQKAVTSEKYAWYFPLLYFLDHCLHGVQVTASSQGNFVGTASQKNDLPRVSP